MKIKKVTYVLSKIDKAIAFEWIYDAMKDSVDFTFIFIGETKGQLYHWLKERGVKVFFIFYKGKKSLPKAFGMMLWIFIKNRPKVIHTHLFEANLIGLTAAKILGIPKRIYTRHHSTFHHEYYPKAIKWDKWCNKLATDVVAISKNVEKVLIQMENLSPKKIHLISHGFDLNAFQQVTNEEIEELKIKYQFDNEKAPVIGVISRYIKLKGLKYIILSFKKIVALYPNAILVLANSNGPDKAYIKSLLKKHLLSNQYIEISFENNLFALYQLFDVFVHVPINREIEAFGQTYVEALAAAVPSVFTLSGIANDFIIDRRNALVVDYKNEDQIEQAVLELLTNKELVEKIKENGMEDVKDFSVERMTNKLSKLYSE